MCCLTDEIGDILCTRVCDFTVDVPHHPTRPDDRSCNQKQKKTRKDKLTQSLAAKSPGREQLFMVRSAKKKVKNCCARNWFGYNGLRHRGVVRVVVAAFDQNKTNPKSSKMKNGQLRHHSERERWWWCGQPPSGCGGGGGIRKEKVLQFHDDPQSGLIRARSPDEYQWRTPTKADVWRSAFFLACTCVVLKIMIFTGDETFIKNVFQFKS